MRSVDWTVGRRLEERPTPLAPAFLLAGVAVLSVLSAVLTLLAA